MLNPGRERRADRNVPQLPFNVSWQEVKDHVRQVCVVDHVEIFPKSTSGWVRVKGFEHFKAAFGTIPLPPTKEWLCEMTCTMP